MLVLLPDAWRMSRCPHSGFYVFFSVAPARGWSFAYPVIDFLQWKICFLHINRFTRDLFGCPRICTACVDRGMVGVDADDWMAAFAVHAASVAGCDSDALTSRPRITVVLRPWRFVDAGHLIVSGVGKSFCFSIQAQYFAASQINCFW